MKKYSSLCSIFAATLVFSGCSLFGGAQTNPYNAPSASVPITSPSSSVPASSHDISDNLTGTITQNNGGTVLGEKLIKPEIKVDTPLVNATVSSPLNISGQAVGNWYFEASFPIQLVDDSGKVLAQTPAQAQSDWMTTDFVPFTAQLTFDSGTATSGKIILKNDNPSGNPATQKIYELPVKFAGAAAGND
jgi:hypothetical protein